MINFINGTALAVMQDNLIALRKSGGVIQENDIKNMEDNLWVAAAYKLAPSNLVIRQYALIDLARNSPAHRDRIVKLFDILSYGHIYPNSESQYRLWAEGYSYFLYTMAILKFWMNRFKDTVNLVYLQSMVRKVESGFTVTAYFRNGTYYPAPFGDLRDIPLIPEHQSSEVRDITIGNLTRSKNTYHWKAIPLSCNTHVPMDDLDITIKNGIPTPFKFYEGYDRKYKSKWDEYADTFNLKRLWS